MPFSLMRWILFLGFCVLFGCSQSPESRISNSRFTDVTSSSGVTFRNDISITPQLNPYTYRNFYNGAGVAIGDINNDGLQDIYFAANQSGNRLYLNRGNLKFDDITESAGVSCGSVWSTGVTFADINSDGYLDIYVCKSGDPAASRRNNELFINNGDLTFTEKSKEYGLDIIGLSVQAAFFDFDRDGDLDCYLLTNSFKSIGNFDLVKDQRKIPDATGHGNKFLLNDNGKFIDHTAKAGIYSSAIGFGLGITLGDFNNDQWTDIFISNDFFERDYLYINNHDGKFTESLPDYFESLSMGSMGADFADLDNDGNAELFVTEMLPDSLSRKKSKTVYENWNKHQLNFENGYHHQYSRNVLQKRTGQTRFAEVGRYAGVAATEWSWGALLFDMDNDGLRDIFVANGIYRDLLDRDYLTYSASDENIRNIIRTEEQNAILKLIDLMPESKYPNYAFENQGDLRFENVSQSWGFEKPMFSSGSAYGDLDNDGDLDLVVSNLNDPAIIYQNHSTLKSITIQFSMPGKNPFAIGTHATIHAGSERYSADNFVTRGFQSSVPPTVTVGIGNRSAVDSVLVAWPDGEAEVFHSLAAGISHTIKKGSGRSISKVNRLTTSLPFHLRKIEFENVLHHESGLVDFNRDRLLPIMYSNETPSLTTGDINGDGIEEVYMDTGKDYAGVIIGLSDKKISVSSQPIFRQMAIAEQTKSHFVDVDNDGDIDLYAASGGRFFPPTSSALTDQILLNDGRGNFSPSAFDLPFTRFISTSAVRSLDYDKDGDADLIVGERFDPFVYGKGGRAYIFANDGKGKFSDVTHAVAPELEEIGMVTDIEVLDRNRDGWMDVVVVGDWMPITLLENSEGVFKNVSKDFDLLKTRGWWNDVEVADLNGDGTDDFVLANHGLNTFFKSGDRMYVSDFDDNGSIEQIYCTKINEEYFPVLEKDDLLSQLPSLKKQLLYYRHYAKQSIDDLFGKEKLKGASILEVEELSSLLLLSEGKTGYRKLPMPKEAQFAPLYAILIDDFDHDGIDDVIAGGNQYLVKPQFGRFDASDGWFFKGGRDNGTFTLENGISMNVRGQIRDIEMIELKEIKYLLFSKYDDELEIFQIQY